jgi:hypothetical protein
MCLSECISTCHEKETTLYTITDYYVIALAHDIVCDAHLENNRSVMPLE